jgi:hypothetical protein
MHEGDYDCKRWTTLCNSAYEEGTLERIGQLPVRLQVEKEIYEEAVQFITA